MSRISAILLCLLLAGCGGASDGKVHVSYWEKWTGAEGEAMQKVVDQFNRRQDKIVVEYLGISDVARKTLIATAGGDPPDVAGIWLANVYTFADQNALLPLDDFIRGEGTTPETVGRTVLSRLWGHGHVPRRDVGAAEHALHDGALLE